MKRRSKSALVLAGGILIGLLTTLLILAVAFPGTAAGQNFHPTIITAAEFRIVDPNGQIKMSLNESGISLFDKHRKKRLEIRVEPTTGVHILGPDEQPRAELFLFPDGGSHLYLHDDDGRLRTVIDEAEFAFKSVSADELIVDLDDETPGTLRLMTTGSHGPNLSLVDSLGRSKVLLGMIPRALQSDAESAIDEAGILIFNEQQEITGQFPNN